MFRAVPVSNRIIHRKSVERSQQRHEGKLQNLKPSVPDERPQTFAHLKHNKKKDQLTEERYTEIERCNRILLDRLTNIMKKSTQSSNIKAPTQPPTRARSLNRDMRKRELVKITIDNQQMLKRLQDRKSQYNVNDWLEKHKQEQKYLQNISSYPIQLYSHNTTRIGAFDEEESIKDQTLREDVLKDLSFTRPKTHEQRGYGRSVSPIGQINNISESFSGVSNGRRRQSRRLNEENQLDEVKVKGSTPNIRRNDLPIVLPLNTTSAKKVLYQGKSQFGGNIYLIQIYMQSKYFRPQCLESLHPIQKKQGLRLIQQPRKKQTTGERLLGKYKRNFNALIEQMKFKGNYIYFESENQNNSAEDHLLNRELQNNTFSWSQNKDTLSSTNIKEEDEMNEMLNIINEQIDSKNEQISKRPKSRGTNISTSNTDRLTSMTGLIKEELDVIVEDSFQHHSHSHNNVEEEQESVEEDIL